MSASYPPHFTIFGDNKISADHPWYILLILIQVINGVNLV